jgi:hypothetical protein
MRRGVWLPASLFVWRPCGRASLRPAPTRHSEAHTQYSSNGQTSLAGILRPVAIAARPGRELSGYRAHRRPLAYSRRMDRQRCRDISSPSWQRRPGWQRSRRSLVTAAVAPSDVAPGCAALYLRRPWHRIEIHQRSVSGSFKRDESGSRLLIARAEPALDPCGSQARATLRCCPLAICTVHFQKPMHARQP